MDSSYSRGASDGHDRSRRYYDRLRKRWMIRLNPDQHLAQHYHQVYLSADPVVLSIGIIYSIVSLKDMGSETSLTDNAIRRLLVSIDSGLNAKRRRPRRRHQHNKNMYLLSSFSKSGLLTPYSVYQRNPISHSFPNPHILSRWQRKQGIARLLSIQGMVWHSRPRHQISVLCYLLPTSTSECLARSRSRPFSPCPIVHRCRSFFCCCRFSFFLCSVSFLHYSSE